MNASTALVAFPVRVPVGQIAQPDAEPDAKSEARVAASVVVRPGSVLPVGPLRPQLLRPQLLRPETLHPALWLGHQLGRNSESVMSSGFGALDVQLPGGGWPRRALSELLLLRPGVGEIRLLSPCLTAVQRAGRLVMLFDPPSALSAGALAQLGFDVEALLIIDTQARRTPGTDSLWALEQALKSGYVGAVLAWLPPRLPTQRLRRLQLAAQSHDGPAFVLREMSAAQGPSAAPLRLGLHPHGADVLAVRVLKRRGPPLEVPLQLTLPPVLTSMALQRAAAGVVPPDRTSTQGLRAATFVNLAEFNLVQ